MWANMMNGQGWAGMGVGMIGMLIFGILILVLIVALFGRMLSSDGSGDKQQKTALEILRQRYAAGEIEREEYEQKKRDLAP